jgi:glutathione peroxidase
MKMKLVLLILAGMTLIGAALAVPSLAEQKPVAPALSYTMNDIDGKPVNLAKYQGQVVMIVNVASYCGLTKQYTNLQAMYEKYKAQGFTILAFPANEFGKQEPGTNAEIKTFCSSKYNVTFPMFSKVVVKGEGQTPLYKFLTDKETSPKTAGDIEWNFAKFILNRKGEVVARVPSRTDPLAPEVVAIVEKELATK